MAGAGSGIGDDVGVSVCAGVGSRVGESTRIYEFYIWCGIDVEMFQHFYV